MSSYEISIVLLVNFTNEMIGQEVGIQVHFSLSFQNGFWTSELGSATSITIIPIGQVEAD